MKELEIFAQLSDLKNIDYRNTLAIATLIEILIDKGIISRQEFANKAQELDNMSLEDLKDLRTKPHRISI